MINSIYFRNIPSSSPFLYAFAYKFEQTNFPLFKLSLPLSSFEKRQNVVSGFEAKSTCIHVHVGGGGEGIVFPVGSIPRA